MLEVHTENHWDMLVCLPSQDQQAIFTVPFAASVLQLQINKISGSASQSLSPASKDPAAVLKSTRFIPAVARGQPYLCHCFSGLEAQPVGLDVLFLMAPRQSLLTYGLPFLGFIIAGWFGLANVVQSKRELRVGATLGACKTIKTTMLISTSLHCIPGCQPRA
jgi:hypothetical protein